MGIDRAIDNSDKIIIVGGLPRTGKTLLRNAFGSHSQIAFTPTGFNYFHLFNKDKYHLRGNFDDNLRFFLKEHWIAKKWGLDNISIDITGQNRKDLYLSILELYRNKHWPQKKYIGTYIHNSEEYFNTLLDWFGHKKLKFIQIIRDPFDNYSSLVIARKVDKKNRSSHIYNPFVNKFCNMWAQSATIGLTGAIKYPDSYRTIFFENLKEDPDNYISSLCDWIGIPYEKERMLNMIDYTRKQNSAFSKNNNNTSITRDNIDRKKYLTDYEINTLKKMACTNFLNATEYGKEEVIINWKIKKTQDVNIKEYSKMVCSIKKSLISPLNLRQAILFYSHELFIFDNIKNIISIINNIIRSKIK